MEIKEALFDPMRTHIKRRYNTFAQYIATRNILYLYEAAERKRGAWLGMQWWKQEVIYMTGAKETASAATEAHKDRMGK